jgi:hypothetical protein
MLLVVSVLLLPAAEAQDAGAVLPDELLDRLSEGALIPYLKEHPEQAPDEIAQRLQAAERSAEIEAQPQQTLQPALAAPPGVGVRFNRDNFGLPQNEESVTSCRSNPSAVLGGTNDFRGLLDERGNFTGWHFSNNGGESVRNEGLLTPIRVANTSVPSGGDPVVSADAECNLYAGSLNFDPRDGRPNAIGVYRTTPRILASCPGGNSPECWPERRAVAVGGPNHFLDKEWIYVGRSGRLGTVVWVVYTDFRFTETSFGASIKAVRCSGDLDRCTSPILISGDDRDVQFADVTIGADGRTFVTWTEIQGAREGQPQTFIHKLRVAEPASTSFGPTRTVAVESEAIPFGGFLNANDFRVATYPKNEVRIIDGKPHVFVVWDACRQRVLGDYGCERPLIKLKASNDLGASWSRTKTISEGGANYFPTISNAREGSSLAIAYFTSRFDPRFDNRQDIELVALNPRTLEVTKRQRLTPLSNESESDPLLGGFFIGDYIEVFASGNRALVHYNANYRQIRLLESGLPIPQQDNYLKKVSLGQ